MDGESGEKLEGEIESVTSSGEWFMKGWRNKTKLIPEMRWCTAKLAIVDLYREYDVDSGDRVTTTDEEEYHEGLNYNVYFFVGGGGLIIIIIFIFKCPRHLRYRGRGKKWLENVNAADH